MGSQLVLFFCWCGSRSRLYWICQSVYEQEDRNGPGICIAPICVYPGSYSNDDVLDVPRIPQAVAHIEPTLSNTGILMYIFDLSYNNV
jgi:hypothetical protein